jgi:Tol biopolymer transport system component
MRHWATAARAILNFQKSAEPGRRYLIVRYEDLYSDTEREMRRILEFLKLDPERYDFARAIALPVRGSSALTETGVMHWRPVQRTSGFDPLQRWANWNRRRHERFNWIAGEYLEGLGYKKKRFSGGTWFWIAWNASQDGLHAARRLSRVCSNKLAHLPERFFSKPGLEPRNRYTPRKSWIYGGAVAVVFVALSAAIALHFYSPPTVSTAEDISGVPLTSYPGAELYPSFSPDGRQVAFAWNGGNKGTDFYLYRQELGSNQAVRLTAHPAHSLAPAWSPDGKYIAFVRVSTNHSAIYLIPALGGEERKLADASNAVRIFPSVSWSPDGKKLVFSKPRGANDFQAFPPTRLNMLDIETLNESFLPEPRHCRTAISPVFSPHGGRIAAYCISDQGLGFIYIESLNGRIVRVFPRLDGEFGGLTWTADGESILYSMRNSLWLLPVKTGVPQLVAQDAQAPALTRDGRRLAYAQRSSWRKGLSIWRLDLEGAAKAKSNPIKMESSSLGQEAPRISPDGKRVAFESARSGNTEIWVADVDWGNSIQLTSVGGSLTGNPRWSPDGRRVVFDSRTGGNSGLFAVDASGGVPLRIETGTPNSAQPAWSHDGRWIYFTVSGEQKGVWKVPAGGGTATRLTSDNAVMPQESVDGTRVFYSDGSTGLKSVSTRGGDVQEIQELESSSDRWTPGKTGIYFIDDSQARPALKLYEYATGKVLHIIDLPGRVQDWGTGLSISADGSTVVFAVNDLMTGDLMLVNEFHN